MSARTLVKKVHAGDPTAIATGMGRAMRREAGSVGKFDAARKVFREAESHLLNRVAAGSPRAFQQLDMLRKSPLGFAPTVFEGVALDYGPRGMRDTCKVNFS